MRLRASRVDLEPVIGLEIHAQLQTATKIFCGCPARFGEVANHDVCPVCLGLPGALPVVNAVGVESAIRIGLALNCEIATWCRFCLLYTSDAADE